MEPGALKNVWKPFSPIIVIGMHRSGTSMLTRAMQSLGLYMGRRTTRNEENPYTNALNRWIFSQASATWERPEGVDLLLTNWETRALVTDYLQGVIAGPSSVRYLGILRWLRYRSLLRVGEPWGWKDPRNAYTLPLWLELFPKARVLHIIRHGVDVAVSLRKRRDLATRASARRYLRYRRLYVNDPFAPKRSGFAHSARCAVLEGGLDLWNMYTARAHNHVDELGDRALEFRYEDFLHEPLPYLQRIAEFCSLDAPLCELRRNASGFKTSRAYAYRSSPELVEFAERNSRSLAQFGY